MSNAVAIIKSLQKTIQKLDRAQTSSSSAALAYEQDAILNTYLASEAKKEAEHAARVKARLEELLA